MSVSTALVLVRLMHTELSLAAGASGVYLVHDRHEVFAAACFLASFVIYMTMPDKYKMDPAKGGGGSAG